MMISAESRMEHVYFIKAGEVLVRDPRRPDGLEARRSELCRLQRNDYIGEGAVLQKGSPCHAVGLDSKGARPRENSVV